MPVSTPIFPTVGPTEGVSVLNGQGVGLQRSSCRSAAAYATNGTKVCFQCLSLRFQIASNGQTGHMVDNSYRISQPQTGCMPDHLSHRQLAASCIGKNHSISVSNRATSGIYLPTIWATLGLQATEWTGVGFHPEHLATGRIGASFLHRPRLLSSGRCGIFVFCFV